ncbi:hypothetical protein RUND412_006871 [Rhizina undulata]
MTSGDVNNKQHPVPPKLPSAFIAISPTDAQRRHIVSLVSLLAPTRRPSTEGSHEAPRGRSRSLSRPSELHDVVIATATRPTPGSKTMAKPIEPESPSREKLNHSRVASFLGVDRRYYVSLMVYRGLSVCPSLFSLLKCFLAIWKDMAFQCSTAEVSQNSWDLETEHRAPNHFRYIASLAIKREAPLPPSVVLAL